MGLRLGEVRYTGPCRAMRVCWASLGDADLSYCTELEGHSGWHRWQHSGEPCTHLWPWEWLVWLATKARAIVRLGGS